MKRNQWVLVCAWISLFACVISLFVLPDQIPIHWNSVGEIDGYGSKYFVLVFGGLGLGNYYLMNVMKKIDPLENKIDEKLETYQLMRDLLTVMMSAMTFVFLLGIFIPNFDISSAITILLGAFFLLIGNDMPRVPHNYFLGCKTPWAYADENNWKKTQRVGGYVFCLSGLLMIVSGLLHMTWAMIFSVVALMIGTIFVYFYSWFIYKHSR